MSGEKKNLGGTSWQQGEVFGDLCLFFGDGGTSCCAFGGGDLHRAHFHVSFLHFHGTQMERAGIYLNGKCPLCITHTHTGAASCQNALFASLLLDRSENSSKNQKGFLDISLELFFSKKGKSPGVFTGKWC